MPPPFLTPAPPEGADPVSAVGAGLSSLAPGAEPAGAAITPDAAPALFDPPKLVRMVLAALAFYLLVYLLTTALGIVLGALIEYAVWGVVPAGGP